MGTSKARVACYLLLINYYRYRVKMNVHQTNGHFHQRKLCVVDVGLNWMCHLKETMDQFAPNVDEQYHPGVARHVLPAFHRFAVLSHFVLFLWSPVSVWQDIMFYLLCSLFLF